MTAQATQDQKYSPEQLLERSGINTLGQLLQYSEEQLMAIKNFNSKSLEELVIKLGNSGLRLKDS